MKKKPTSSERTNAAFAQMIDYCSKNYGAKSELVRRYVAKTSGCGHRALVERWLTPDASKRIEPHFGSGVMLLEAFEEMLKERNGGK
jgi:hypothetical protein